MGHSNYNSETKVWSGAKHESIYNSNVSLGFLILNVLKNTPDRITQVSADTNVEITCHEMRMRTMKIATHLMNSGFKQGDVVGIMASNSENLAPVVFACFTLGLSINTLAPVMTENDIIHMYGKTKPKIIFCDANIAQRIKSAVDKINLASQIYTFMDKVEDYNFVDDILLPEFDGNKFAFPKLVNISTSAAFILCSSGTTGLPKGVCKSHSQIINQMFTMWNRRSQGQEVFFNFSTLYWVTGMAFLVMGTLYGGKRVITTRNFSPDLMIEIFQRFRVTTVFSAPSALALLLKKENLQPFPYLETLMVSGSYVSKNLCEAFEPYIPNGIISPCLGISEGDFVADSFLCQRYGSVGKLSPNVQVKIVDEADEKLGANQQGEICFKTAVTFSQYFEDPEKTAATIKDGWVYSGDIGYFDDDGFLFVVDRIKDMLKYNGFQVYPTELETMINDNDGVKNSCVVGIFEEEKGNDLIFVKICCRINFYNSFSLLYSHKLCCLLN